VSDETYQALYRKYRPQAPDEVVGQEHVVRALVGAVREDKLAHAFLFCGPRGTGKTSTARILAKMINCDLGPTAEPCGTCEQCVRIREGSHLDVVEIDAASHGGVDDARELRERAPTAPAMGREKVYILDEAQRLSREAFDALLKLFEEPPPAVRFVLATTEPHKMPATIVGRCQRFDFRRISVESLADLLERVAKDEGIELARPAAEVIARQSEGSARDAESLLDQSAVLGAGHITEETVASLIGAPQGAVQFELADAVAVGDTRGVFELVDRLVQEGQDLRHLTGQVLGHFRDLLLVQSAPEETSAIDVSPEEHSRLVAQAGKFTPAELARVISLLLAAQTDMRWTTAPRLTLELALVRATIPEADPSGAGLASRIERLERLAGVTDVSGTRPQAGRAHSAGEQVSDRQEVADPAPAGQRASTRQEVAGGRSAGQPPPNPGSATAADHHAGTPLVTEEATAGAPVATEEAAVEEASAGVPHAADVGALDLATIRRSWSQLLDHLQSERRMILRANLESATPAAWDGTTLELAFPPGRKFAVKKVQEKDEELRAAFAHVFGVAPAFRCEARDEVPGMVILEDEEEPPSAEDAIARLKAELGAEVEPDSGEGP
jgi:DNA polymerase-3 subunit gamma/tau